MTTQTIVLPYQRTANHIPRRDLVLAMADSLALEVSVVEWDSPSAPAIELSGGLGGPKLSLFIWPWSRYPLGWDYGAWWTTGAGPSGSTAPLWSGDFTVDPDAAGTFQITFPLGTMATWPRRACWSMQLAWDTDQASQLAWGHLHVMPSPMGSSASVAAGITTDSDIGITTDALDPITTD